MAVSWNSWASFIFFLSSNIFFLIHWPLKIAIARSSYFGPVEMNLTSIHEDRSLIPGPGQWVKDPVLP